MKQSLNFSWSFIKGYDESYLNKLDKSLVSEVNIPHNPVEIPYNYFSEKIYQGLFTYEKFFDVEDYQSEKVYILHLEGFMFQADIYLNGENLGKFYSGYLPVDIPGRTKALKKLENKVYNEDQTQLFIETPYRNSKMFETMLQALRPSTKICIAAGITTPEETIITKTVEKWKKSPLPDFEKVPCVFLIGK